MKDGNPARTRRQWQLEYKKVRNRAKAHPYMTLLWCPWAEKDVFKDAGTFFPSTWRGVLHTTEGNSYAGARAVYNNGVAPHFTVSFESGVCKVWQHIPLDRAARALAHPAGTVETNRSKCIQIEIVAHAATSGTLVYQYLDGIGKLMRWIEANTQIQRSAPEFYSDKDGIVLATVNSTIRMEDDEWLSFNGWCGHQHVPNNAHWDPGAIDIDYLLKVDLGVKPVIDPPMNFSKVVHIRKDKYTDSGIYILQEDGAVYAYEGAVYYTGANGQDFFRDRKAAKLLWPEEAQAVAASPEKWLNYKYIIQATSGELYGRP